jgi:riboflavin biosynthesis pyrimidine reductase
MYPDPEWFAVCGQFDWSPSQPAAPYVASLTGADTLWPFEQMPRPAASAEPMRDALSIDVLPAELPEGGLYVFTDSRGRLPAEAYQDLVRQHGDRLLVLVSRATPAGYIWFLEQRAISRMVAGDERVDLRLALERLSELGVREVRSDAGGQLQWALLRAGLVDEVQVWFVPAVFGGRGPGAILFDGPPRGVDDKAVRLRPLAIEPKPDGRIFVRYEPA